MPKAHQGAHLPAWPQCQQEDNPLVTRCDALDRLFITRVQDWNGDTVSYPQGIIQEEIISQLLSLRGSSFQSLQKIYLWKTNKLHRDFHYYSTTKSHALPAFFNVSVTCKVSQHLAFFTEASLFQTTSNRKQRVSGSKNNEVYWTNYDIRKFKAKCYPNIKCTAYKLLESIFATCLFVSMQECICLLTSNTTDARRKLRSSCPWLTVITAVHRHLIYKTYHKPQEYLVLCSAFAPFYREMQMCH